MKFTKEWPKPTMDTYASGQNPPARPKSNHNESYGKSVYNYNGSGAMLPKADKSAGKGSTQQVTDMSKGLKFNLSEVPSFKQAMKKDKHSA